MAALAASGAFAYTRWRGRTGGELEAPEWPPFEPPPFEPVPDEPVPFEPVPDEPESWTAPNDDGSAPSGYPVKVKTSSGIFHVPGGRFYDRTVPDRCYPSEAAAEADGYRRSKT